MTKKINTVIQSVVDLPLTGLRNSEETWLEEFSRRFTEQRGVIHFGKTPAEIAEKINSLIETRGRGSSCAAPGLKLRSGGPATDISTSLNTTVKYTDFERKTKEIARDLDIGITKAQYAIAETGSLVDISYSDEHRLLSSISRVHIAVLDASDVLPKLQDLAPKMKELLSAFRTAPPAKPSVTFIGGPSRTSDIELKSVLGVHGPHEVHAVIYNQG